jgi:hypothetical protein
MSKGTNAEVKPRLSASLKWAAIIVDATAVTAGRGKRDDSIDQVKVTVLLATVLLLTALSQRFEIFGPLVAVAFALLLMSTYSILSLPRA